MRASLKGGLRVSNITKNNYSCSTIEVRMGHMIASSNAHIMPYLKVTARGIGTISVIKSDAVYSVLI